MREPHHNLTADSPATEGMAALPIPPHGWTCYHCGETFNTWGSAEDHFGKTPDRKPGCVIKVQYGHERGLEMELRKAEDAVEFWRNRCIRAEDNEEALQGRLAEFERIAGGGVHELRMKLDEMQGRVITADVLIKAVIEKAPSLYVQIVGPIADDAPGGGR